MRFRTLTAGQRPALLRIGRLSAVRQSGGTTRLVSSHRCRGARVRLRSSTWRRTRREWELFGRALGSTLRVEVAAGDTDRTPASVEQRLLVASVATPAVGREASLTTGGFPAARMQRPAAETVEHESGTAHSAHGHNPAWRWRSAPGWRDAAPCPPIEFRQPADRPYLFRTASASR